MSGIATALTDNFMLGVAEVQIGGVADFFTLTHDNSLGLVKKFVYSVDNTYTELKQGVKGDVVASALTESTARATMEAYEFTAKNIKYALGLDASSGIASYTSTNLQASASQGATTFVVPGDKTATFTTGSWVTIEEDGTFHVAKVASSAFSTNTTVTITGYALPDDFTTAAKVSKMNAITVGGTDDQPFLSAKVLGTLADNTRIYIGFPKIRIVKGFSLAFTTDQFGNMPIEFTPYQQVASDPLYGKYPATNGSAFLFIPD